jgi:flagellar biosynthesis protein FlhF
VGATGVGKTTNLAKLAAQFSVQHRARVGLITTDTYRVAAPEQLRVYANIIGLPMLIANDAAELLRGLKEFEDYDLVMIDTVGGSQFNLDQIRELQAILDPARLDEVTLVLSANTQLTELRSAVKNFGCLVPTSLLFSKLDETQYFGALLTVAAESGLPLGYFSTGQNVPNDIELASPGKVVKLLFSEGGRPVGSGA